MTVYRIKLGEHVTMGDISRGPRAVVECDHINEFVELMKSGILTEIALWNDAGNKAHVERMQEKLKQYGIDN